MKKLTKKFIVLAALTLMLGVFAFTNIGTNSSGAAPCCSDCEELEYECIMMEPGPDRDICFRRLFSCYRWCSFSC